MQIRRRLGPVAVTVRGAPRGIPAGEARALPATLARRAGRPVGTPRTALLTHATRPRRAAGTPGGRTGPRSPSGRERAR